MSRLFGTLAGGIAVTAAGISGSFAQNISNETWLGQVGGTNTIVINQSGRNNRAGADNTGLRVDQDGDRNTLSIDQYGHRNQVGAAKIVGGPTGIKQVGSENALDVVQRTSETAINGGNFIGGIHQRSTDGLEATSNSLKIFQSNTGGNDGSGGHLIRSVRQVYTGTEGAPNHMDIVQTGGGTKDGNLVGDVRQRGTGNRFDLDQHNQLNKVVTVVQRGNSNNAIVEQGQFASIFGGNLLEYLLQEGNKNVVDVKMAGSRNVIRRIAQYNSLLGNSARGNELRVTLEGDSNGSNGNGHVGEFLSDAAKKVSAAQSEIEQFGEGNLTTITISGTENRFGVRQYGEDNSVIVSIGALDGGAALDNESAIFQFGTDNYFSHDVTGSRNVGAARQFGDFNRLDLSQRGLRNVADAFVSGNRNNLEGTNVSFSDLSPALLLALPELKPGKLFQSGLQNTIKVSVQGDDNRFGFHQKGNSNLAESTIIGSGNQVVIAQIGNGNIASSAQYGNHNITVIQQ